MQTTSQDQAAQINEDLSRAVDAVERFLKVGYRRGSAESLKACVEVGRMIALCAVATRTDIVHIAENLAIRWEKDYLDEECLNDDEVDE